MPGWGEYYFVAESGGLRGVSICVGHEEKGRRSREDLVGDGQGDEWMKRGIVWTSSKPLRVLLRMQRGVRVEGRVIDGKGHPVPDFEVPICEDLHYNSHTGVGGEIFSETAHTDSRGRFSFAGVYPNTFYPQVVVQDNLPVWVRTEVRRK